MFGLFRKKKVVAILPVTKPVWDDWGNLLGYTLNWKVVKE